MNENPPTHNEEIEKDIEVGGIEENGQEEEVPAETAVVPPIDPVLAQQIMALLKGLAGPGVLPSTQETQAPTNPHVASTAPKTGGNVGRDVPPRHIRALKFKRDAEKPNKTKAKSNSKETSSSRRIPIDPVVPSWARGSSMRYMPSEQIMI
uniref:Integrase core domain containing protein n=1 Tax=Solanum tuberosum TaxID=4113 RepID=M1DZW4_SOLTU